MLAVTALRKQKRIQKCGQLTNCALTLELYSVEMFVLNVQTSIIAESTEVNKVKLILQTANHLRNNA